MSADLNVTDLADLFQALLTEGAATIIGRTENEDEDEPASADMLAARDDYNILNVPVNHDVLYTVYMTAVGAIFGSVYFGTDVVFTPRGLPREPVVRVDLLRGEHRVLTIWLGLHPQRDQDNNLLRPRHDGLQHDDSKTTMY